MSPCYSRGHSGSLHGGEDEFVLESVSLVVRLGSLIRFGISKVGNVGFSSSVCIRKILSSISIKSSYDRISSASVASMSLLSSGAA